MSDYIEHACPKCGSLICLGQCEEKRPWPYAGHKPGCRGSCDGECEGAAQRILSDLCYGLDRKLKLMTHKFETGKALAGESLKFRARAEKAEPEAKGWKELWAKAQDACAKHARDNDNWRMAAEMVMSEAAFYTDWNERTEKHEGKPILCLNMNDVWAWATADGENVEWYQVPEVYAIWKKDGWDGLLVWCCKKRNAKPQKPVFDKLKPEVQAQLKDLPRFGDATYPIEGGKKSVTFDDGWGD